MWVAGSICHFIGWRRQCVVTVDTVIHQPSTPVLYLWWVMHKKRTYRRRIKTDSDSEEESSHVPSDQATIPKPLSLSFDETLESDIPFVPRAPRARSDHSAKLLGIQPDLKAQKPPQDITLEGADSRLSITHLEGKGYSVFSTTPIPAGIVNTKFWRLPCTTELSIVNDE